MEDPQEKAGKIQSSLCSSSLEDKEEVSARFKDKTFVGKFLSRRKFNHGALASIIEGAWQSKKKVEVQVVAENTFKFVFELKEDKDSIFETRPRSFSGASLILKVWPKDLAVHQIDFNSTTFYVQIHGLPPKWLHLSNADKIGSQLGVVYKDCQ